MCGDLGHGGLVKVDASAYILALRGEKAWQDSLVMVVMHIESVSIRYWTGALCRHSPDNVCCGMAKRPRSPPGE